MAILVFSDFYRAQSTILAASHAASTPFYTDDGTPTRSRTNHNRTQTRARDVARPRRSQDEHSTKHFLISTQQTARACRSGAAPLPLRSGSAKKILYEHIYTRSSAARHSQAWRPPGKVPAVISVLKALWRRHGRPLDGDLESS